MELVKPAARNGIDDMQFRNLRANKTTRLYRCLSYTDCVVPRQFYWRIPATTVVFHRVVEWLQLEMGKPEPSKNEQNLNPNVVVLSLSLSHSHISQYTRHFTLLNQVHVPAITQFMTFVYSEWYLQLVNP